MLFLDIESESGTTVSKLSSIVERFIYIHKKELISSIKSHLLFSLNVFPEMATAGSLLSEEQLLCPICLDLFNQPVSTPCGHNFCRDCIQGYWKSAHLSQCPVCKERFYRRPKLKVNTFISEVVSQFKKLGEKKDDAVDQSLEHAGDSLCDVTFGKGARTLKSCLHCFASFCEIHPEPPRVLRTSRKQHVLSPNVNMQDGMCEKHEKLLNLFCNTDLVSVCQICIQKDHKAHHTIPMELESGEKRAQIGRMHAELENMIHDRLWKISEITQSVELSRRNTDREIKECLQVFTKLLRCIQKGQAEVVEGIDAMQRQVESTASGLITELEQEIDDIKKRSNELEQLSHAEDNQYLLQTFPAFSTLPTTKDWSDICLASAVHVGTVRSAVRRVARELEDTIKAEGRRLCKTEFQRAQHCAVDVTLDPDTAHPKLVLSENKKQVYHGDAARSLPENPERFYPGVSVLGKEGFSSGRFYYEVQVKGKTEWDIGVGLESVNRKGGNILNPENGYWALGLRKDKGCWALSSPPICVPLVEMPQRVGVYVDLEWGQVSFYNVETASHIYSFTGCSFSERLFPYFNPRRNHGGINSAPLIIWPV